MAAKTLICITGASQGIGRTIAIKMAKNYAEKNAVFALTARSTIKLNETKAEILKINSKFVVQTFPLDLSKAQQNDFNCFVEQMTPLGPFVESVLFHNAGQTGYIKSALNLQDLPYWHDYFHMNYFSVVALTGVFVKQLKELSQKIVIVNVTSLVGRQPFVNFAMYGSGKAARELYFKVLAKEEPDLLILNYSPGPVDTDMFNDVITGAEGEQTRKQFAEMKEQKQVLSTEQTVAKLLDLLEKKQFESGDTIDYYDRL